MFTMKLVACLLIGITLTSAKPVKSKISLPNHVYSSHLGPFSKDAASDAYIDMVLEKARELIVSEGLDPAALPEGIAEFSQDILGITFHGSARVYNGFFSGLSQIHRTGETSLTVDAATQTAKLSAFVGLDRATAGYDARAEFMDIGIGASAAATLENFSVYLEASMCLNEGCKLTLDAFNIDNIGSISVDFDGLGPLDWILEVVVDLVANLIKDFLADVIEGPIRDIIQGILDDLPPPIKH